MRGRVVQIPRKRFSLSFYFGLTETLFIGCWQCGIRINKSYCPNHCTRLPNTYLSYSVEKMCFEHLNRQREDSSSVTGIYLKLKKQVKQGNRI